MINLTSFFCFILGQEAKKLFADAQELLKSITKNNLLQARGIVGLYPAVSFGDDIILLNDDHETEIGRLYGIRQQV